MKTQVILLLALFSVSTYAALTVVKSGTLSDGRVVKVGTQAGTGTGTVDCAIEEYASKTATTATTTKVLVASATGKVCSVTGATLDDDDNIWVALKTDAAAGLTLAKSLVKASEFVTEQNVVLCLDKTTGASTFGTTLFGTYLASHNTAAGGTAAAASGATPAVTPGALTVSSIEYCEVEDIIRVKGTSAQFPPSVTSLGSGTQVFDTAFLPATGGTVWYTFTPSGAASAVKAKSATAPTCTASAGRLIVSSMLLVILALFI